MSYFNDGFQPDKNKDKNKKVTAPLIIHHFNPFMCMMCVDITLLYLFMGQSNVPNWMMTILQFGFWLIWSCGVILILGYFVAILDHNVIVIETKKKENKPENKK